MIYPRYDFFVYDGTTFIANKRQFESSMNFREGMKTKAAEVIQDFVYIFYRHHYARSRGERFDLSAPISDFCEHTLDGHDFVADIQIAVGVHLVKKGGCKLLEWVDVILYARNLRDKTLCDGRALILQSLNRGFYQKLFDFV